MAVRYAALCASRKVHVCHCNSLGGATWRSVTIDNGTDGQTDRQTDRVRRNMRPPPREEGRIISPRNVYAHWFMMSSDISVYSFSNNKHGCLNGRGRRRDGGVRRGASPRIFILIRLAGDLTSAITYGYTMRVITIAYNSKELQSVVATCRIRGNVGPYII